MLRLPDGVTLDDVFAELPDIGNDPDVRAMVTDMHESGCSVYRAAANRFATGETRRAYETLYYHLFRAQRRIYQAFDTPVDKIIETLMADGQIVVNRERMPEIELACKTLGIPVTLRTHISVQRG